MTLETLLRNLADAFSHEEAKNGRVHEVHMGKKAFFLLSSSSDFETISDASGIGRMWNARIVCDRHLSDAEFVLRYRRAESGDVRPIPPKKHREKRYIKKLKFAAVPEGG